MAVRIVDRSMDNTDDTFLYIVSFNSVNDDVKVPINRSFQAIEAGKLSIVTGNKEGSSDFDLQSGDVASFDIVNYTVSINGEVHPV